MLFHQLTNMGLEGKRNAKLVAELKNRTGHSGEVTAGSSVYAKDTDNLANSGSTSKTTVEVGQQDDDRLRLALLAQQNQKRLIAFRTWGATRDALLLVSFNRQLT